MDVDRYCATVLTEIDRQLASFSGPSRLERLRSYYSTWRLPFHPASDELHALVCRISDRRANARQPYNMSELDALFTLTVPVADEPILEHCRRHYVILREINREMLAQ